MPQIHRDKRGADERCDGVVRIGTVAVVAALLAAALVEPHANAQVAGALLAVDVLAVPGALADHAHLVLDGVHVLRTIFAFLFYFTCNVLRHPCATVPDGIDSGG